MYERNIQAYHIAIYAFIVDISIDEGGLHTNDGVFAALVCLVFTPLPVLLE